MQMCPNYFHDFDPAGKTSQQAHTHAKKKKKTSVLFEPCVTLIIFKPVCFSLLLCEESFLLLVIKSYITDCNLSMTRFIFFPTEKVIKVCNSDGQWFRHPESNRIWTNYTQCQAYTKTKLKVKHNNVVPANVLKHR